MEILNQWQTLIGAIIGASASFIIWFIARYFDIKSKSRNELHFAKTQIVIFINSITSAINNLEEFTNVKLLNFENKLQSSSNACLDKVFFPRIDIFLLSEKIPELRIGSMFIDNKIYHLYNLNTKNQGILEDMRSQYNESREMLLKFYLERIIKIENINQNYIEQIINFRNTMNTEIIYHNLYMCLRLALVCKSALELFERKGKLLWNLRFHPKYSFYFSKEDYQLAIDNNYKKMEKQFELLIDDEFKKLTRPQEN